MGWVKKLFGGDHRDNWERLSSEVGAEFIEGGFFKGSHKVRLAFEEWVITLDTYTVSTGKSTITFTRIQAPFTNLDGFEFTVYRKTWASGVGKLLGMQDVTVGGPGFDNLQPMFGTSGYVDPELIESGDTQFDQDFIVKSNNEEKVRSLFKAIRIRDLLQAQPELDLRIKEPTRLFSGKKVPDEVILYFQVTGIITDVERLKKLFELFKEVLKELKASGTAAA